MEVNISFKIDIDKKDFEQFKRLEHHIEELVDLDSWPEIQTIYDIKVTKKEN